MTDQIHSQLEWYSISKAQFSFLSPNEIRKMSCCEIFNPVVYDTNKQPSSGGLYDPLLGVSPSDRNTECKTCGHEGMKCSGHPGHIQLVVPTYNPMIMDILVKVLRMNCFNCHRLRIKRQLVEKFQIMIVLIKNGFVTQAKEYWKIDPEILRKRLKKLEKEKLKNKDDEKQKQIQNKKIENCKKSIERMYEIEKQFIKLAKKQEKGTIEGTSSSIEAFSQYFKIFYSYVQKKCPHCDKMGKNIKKDGANKIFLISTVKEEKIERKKSRDITTTARGDSVHMINELTEQTHRGQKKKINKQKYLTVKEVKKELKFLWTNETRILNLLFGNGNEINSESMFFLYTLFVPPSRFRPESKLGDEKYLHDQTNILGRILNLNQDLRSLVMFQKLGEVVEKQGQKAKRARATQFKALNTLNFRKSQWFSKSYQKAKNQNQFITKWLELQDSVNCFLDATKSSKMSDKDFKGVRQILQKKEGLFRMKMMGKRVNYAARSVISPDPSLNTNQVGLPLFMAKKLTFPEPVNEHNLQNLQKYIKNGKSYPGANFLEENGRMIKLDYLDDEKRLSLARNLLVNCENKVVYRHMIDGDNVLFNRQPTLHKAGLMAHKIKVLPKQSTLRMNYANCKSYNADFDGDQMNLHAIQNYMGKAEAQLCISDKMYNNPTNGKPLRQIMQDAVISAVYMTMKDTFFNKKDYSQLLYQATFSLLDKKPKNTRLFLLKPAIMKPKQLWTGKQLVSNVIKIIVSFSDLKFKNQKGLCMKANTKISKGYMKGFEEESEVLVVDNELLKGLIDKNQVGNAADYGLIHSFNELYGQNLTGSLITCLTKLFLSYMQVHGFTCGIDDLILKNKVNKKRKGMMTEAHEFVVNEICNNFESKTPQNIDFFGRSAYSCDRKGQYIEEQKRIHVKQTQQILHHLENKVVYEQSALQQLDAEYKHHLHPKSSSIIDTCLFGFKKMFPQNNFSMMTITGAKGSNVNHSQVSVMLGQQQLQGRRVPVMISGKTLPSFLPYDPNPRASGYISDRFLTGLREQQFYFHCMAGRQGLIDTAVKTSRSGYLQRCLMKHLETLKVEYDYSVRDCDGSIIQFYYGQDSLDPTKQKYFHKFDFLENNYGLLKKKYKYDDFKEMLKTKKIMKFKEKNKTSNKTIMDAFPPNKNFGSISEKCFAALQDKNFTNEDDKKQFSGIYSLKYFHDMIQPGQSVGCTAAQSIGQPSTQMTLNTFHLAGHGGVNLTLGIPRLRQLLMTSSDKIKTPVMELYFKDRKSKEEARQYAKQLQKLKLSAFIQSIQVEEWKQLYLKQKLLAHGDRKRYYKISIKYEKQQFIQKQFGLDYAIMNEKISKMLVPQLLNYINRVKKRNQLRAQIKRVSAADKYEEEDEQKDKDKEEMQDGYEETEKNKSKKKEKEKNKMVDEKDEKNEKQQNYNSQEFENLSFHKDGCDIIIKVSLNFKKFLMTKVVENLLSNTVIREVKGIRSASILQKKNGEPYIQTEGVNFDIVSDLDFINKTNIGSNDIQAITKKFGVQAARTALVNEIVNLFGAYGVTVDYRHLYLIGDYITYGGNIKAMNRNWMAYSASPFLRMSYETSVKFITGAALHCEVDNCKSPSSRIILGQNPNLGTGICDLLMDSRI